MRCDAGSERSARSLKVETPGLLLPYSCQIVRQVQQRKYIPYHLTWATLTKARSLLPESSQLTESTRLDVSNLNDDTHFPASTTLQDFYKME